MQKEEGMERVFLTELLTNVKEEHGEFSVFVIKKDTREGKKQEWSITVECFFLINILLCHSL